MKTSLRICWIAVGTLFVVACLQRVWDFDFWWLLATGRETLQNGFPRQESLASGALGQPVIELRWLFCVGMMAAVSAFGYVGATVLKTLLLLAAGWISLRAGWNRSSSLFLPAIAGVAVVASNARLILRPEIATYLLLATFLYAIQGYRAGRLRKDWLWSLPLLQIVWVNAHTLFILGPLVALAWALIETLPRTRTDGGSAKLAWSLAVSVWLACIVNPYGAQSFLFAWTIFGEARESLFKEVIAELQSPLAFGFRYSATVGLLVLTCIFALTLLSSIRRLDPFLTIVSVAMGVLAWSAVRNIPLFAVAALPFIVWHLRAEEPLRAKPFLTLFTVAASAFFIWAMGTDRLHLWQNESNQFGASLAERRFPLAVVDGLVKSNPSRPVFNSMEIGGLLRWRGVPYYVDARLEVFGERVYERYFDAAKTRNELARILDEYQMEDALVSITSPFVPLLLSMEGWSLVAYDANGCWFSRRVRANQPVALELPGPPVPYRSAGLFTRCLSPTPYLNLAILYDHLNQTAEALRWSDAALQAYPNGLGIESVRGSLLYRLGRMDEARAAFERAVALDPEDASAWSGLGAVLATEGRSEDAKRSLNRALQIEPRDANAWTWLASVKAQEQDLAGAAAALEQAIQVGGESSNALAFLGDVQQARGLLNAAEQAYRKALSMDPTNRRAAAGAIVLLRRKGDEAGARRVLEAYERATGKADDELKGLFR